jgi:hypothetical protein
LQHHVLEHLFSCAKAKRPFFQGEEIRQNLKATTFMMMTHLARRVDVDTFIVVAQKHLHAVRVGQRHDRVRSDCVLNLNNRKGRNKFSIQIESVNSSPVYVFWDVDVVDCALIEVDGVKSFGRSINDFEASSFFDSQID